jgi:hypothetical protein
MSKIISGLDFLGRSVDLLELDPFDVANSCKTVQLILTTKDQTYEKEGYDIPSGVEAFLQPRTTIEGGETLMSNSYDFQREFSKSMEANAGVEGIFEFSASQSFKTTARETESREEIFTYLIASHSLCVATFDLDGVSSEYLQVNANVKDAVSKLPTVADKKAYRDFIKKFGTHFLSTVTLGGMAYSKVSSKSIEMSSSSSVVTAFKTDARFTVKKASAGAGHSEGAAENQARDAANKITRTSISYVGGKGDPEQIDSSWISSVEDMSVPIAASGGKNNFVLRRISTLLTPRFFDTPEEPGLATRRALLDEEISHYIRERGGDESGRIRYGQPVKLQTVFGGGKRLYFNPKRTAGRRPLYDRDPNYPIEPGSAEATFEIYGSGKVNGEEVLAGNSLTFEIKGTNTFATIVTKPIENGPSKGKVFGHLVLSANRGRAEGDYSLRIRGSGQPYDGSEMTERMRPLVSGDVVMISRRDADRRKFVLLHTPSMPAEIGGVFSAETDTDPLLSPVPKERDYFVLRNA